MLKIKLAFKNILGAGLRTWLNAIVLSIVFVAIIFMNGIIQGMNNSATKNMKETIYGGGQYWHKNYDPYDPLTIEESHARPPRELQQLIQKDLAEPIMITRGTLYPQGRITNILIKGIDSEQDILNMPMNKLSPNIDYIPAIIGTRMAETTDLKKNDIVTLRWRDKDGTFDAADVKIVHIMNTLVPAVDQGQIWVPYSNLQDMTGTENHSTIIVTKKGFGPQVKQAGEWEFKSLDFLLKDLEQMQTVQFISYAFMYLLLLILALLAVFDTQVLAIFHRKREIGMLIALGMEKQQVISLFTIEGALQAVLSLIIGAVYGTPLLLYTANQGIALPESTSDFGLAISSTLYPIFGWRIIAGSAVCLLIAVTVVSYFPARRISDFDPQAVLAGRE